MKIAQALLYILQKVGYRPGLGGLLPMIEYCQPTIRLLLALCLVYIGRLPQHFPPMPLVLQIELDIGYLVKAAPLAPTEGMPLKVFLPY